MIRSFSLNQSDEVTVRFPAVKVSCHSFFRKVFFLSVCGSVVAVWCSWFFALCPWLIDGAAGSLAARGFRLSLLQLPGNAPRKRLMSWCSVNVWCHAFFRKVDSLQFVAHWWYYGASGSFAVRDNSSVKNVEFILFWFPNFLISSNLLFGFSITLPRLVLCFPEEVLLSSVFPFVVSFFPFSCSIFVSCQYEFIVPDLMA